MPERRFTVRYLKNVGYRLGGVIQSGWRVCDNGKPITITYDSEEEALWHLPRIEALYERFGYKPWPKTSD